MNLHIKENGGVDLESLNQDFLSGFKHNLNNKRNKIK